MKDNKLIAEFMGAVGTPKYNPTEWDVYITGYLDVDSDDENAQHFYTPDEMKYRISWDWLMPVVQKIETLGYWFNRNIGDVTIVDNDGGIVISTPYSVGGHDMYYKAVVEFIKQYNESNKMDTLPTSVQQG